MAEVLRPGSDRASAYSLHRGDYRRPKKADLREMEKATENRPYYAALAALEMCGIVPPKNSIEKRLEQLRNSAKDFPLGGDEPAKGRLAAAEIDAQIVEIEIDSAIYRLVRHDVLLANYFYHDLSARPDALKALLDKTEAFNDLPCLREVLVMEKKNLIGLFTRKVALGTLKIMIALENNLLSDDEREAYEQLAARHVK